MKKFKIIILLVWFSWEMRAAQPDRVHLVSFEQIKEDVKTGAAALDFMSKVYLRDVIDMGQSLINHREDWVGLKVCPENFATIMSSLYESKAPDKQSHEQDFAWSDNLQFKLSREQLEQSFNAVDNAVIFNRLGFSLSRPSLIFRTGYLYQCGFLYYKALLQHFRTAFPDLDQQHFDDVRRHFLAYNGKLAYRQRRVYDRQSCQS